MGSFCPLFLPRYSKLKSLPVNEGKNNQKINTGQIDIRETSKCNKLISMIYSSNYCLLNSIQCGVTQHKPYIINQLIAWVTCGTTFTCHVSRALARRPACQTPQPSPYNLDQPCSEWWLGRQDQAVG